MMLSHFLHFGFANTSVTVKTENGLDDTLLSPLYFCRKDYSIVRAPAGSTTDGLSVPRIFQNFIPATGGDWYSAVIHDAAYRGYLEIEVEGTDDWVKANFTQKQADDLILEAMESQKVGFIERWTIYLALRAFGSFAFNETNSKPSYTSI